MKKTTVSWMVLAALFWCLPEAMADVTLKGTSSGKGIGQLADGESLTYIKGLRMRSDSAGGRSTIIDAERGRMILLNHKKKQAEVTDTRDISKQLEKISGEGIQASLKSTGRTRQMLGETVEEYQVTIRIPISPAPDQSVVMVMSGPAWIAPDSPARRDFGQFYLAAAEKGLFFGDPQAAKAQPGPAKAMTELYRRMAEAGVPYSMEMQVKFEGEGMLAAMMSRMASSSFQNTINEVSVGPLSDDLFEIPAGYKVKNR